jgi:hypothetical protein
MTKEKARRNKLEWKRALLEGRVVRINGGETFTAYLTVETARRAVEAYREVGLAAEIVEWRVA